MMKRVLLVVMAFLLILMTSACTQQNNDAQSQSPQQTPSDVATPSTAQTPQSQAPSQPEMKWPEDVLTIIVPVDVGGNMDVKARIVAKYLPKYVGGANVIVDNRPGASGITALTEYLVEPPNTSYLIFASGSHMVLNPYYNDVMYSRDDFIPLVCTDEVENGLFVNPDITGIKTVEDLIAYGQGKIVKFGSSTSGDTFLMTKALLTMAGLDSDAVDANSANEFLVNCLAGHVDVAYAALNLARDFVEEGKLFPLGAFSEEPYTGYKDITVPTFKEQGYDIVHTAFTFFAIRSGTDQAIVDYIEDALLQVMKDPEFIEEFTTAGFVMLEDHSHIAVDNKLDILSDNLASFDKLLEQ